MLGGDAVSLEINKHNTELMKKLKSMKGVKSIKHHDGKITVMMENGERRIPDLFKLAQKTKTEIKYVSLRKPSLENVFLHFTGKTIREHEATQKERNIMFMARRRMAHG